MTVVADLLARLRADTSDFVSGINDAVDASTRADQAVGGLGDKMAAMGHVGEAAAVAVGGGMALLADHIIGAAVSYNTFNQQAEILFSALEGGKAAADAQIASLDDMSVALGQNREALSGAAKYLQIMTDGAHNNAATLHALSDAAAATGQPVDYLGQRFGYLFQQLEQGGGGASYAARSLQLTGVITAQTASELKGMAQNGADASTMWNLLIGSLDKFKGASEAQINTWQGIKNSIHDLFEIDFGRVLTPVFLSFENLLKVVRDALDSPAFVEFTTKFAAGLEHLISPIDSITTKLSLMVYNLNASGIDGIVTKVSQLAPVFGLVAGAFTTFVADIAGGVPVIKDILGPVLGVFDGVGGAILGFLVFTRQTREALANLGEAVLQLVTHLTGLGGALARILNDMAPIAAMFINFVAAIVSFVATHAAILRLAEALLVFVVVARSTIAVFELFKGLDSIGTILANIVARMLGLKTAHQAAADSAAVQQASEARLGAALTGLTEQLNLATAAQIRLNEARAIGSSETFLTPIGPIGGLGSLGGSTAEVGTAAAPLAEELAPAALGLGALTGGVGTAVIALGALAAAFTFVSGAAHTSKTAIDDAKASIDTWGQTHPDNTADFDQLKSNADDAKTHLADLKKERDNLPARAGFFDKLVSGAMDPKAWVPFNHEQLDPNAAAYASSSIEIANAQGKITSSAKELQTAQANVNRIMIDTGATQDQVIAKARELGQSLTFADDNSGAGVLKTIETGIRGVDDAATQALKSVAALKDGLTNMSGIMAGSMGQQTIDFTGPTAQRAINDNRAALQTISDQWGKGEGDMQVGSGPNLAAAALKQLDSLSKLQGMPTKDANDTTLQNMANAKQQVDLTYQLQKATEGHTNALYSLKQAQESFADSQKRDNFAVADAAYGHEQAIKSLQKAYDSFDNTIENDNHAMVQARYSQEQAMKALVNANQSYTDTLHRNEESLYSATQANTKALLEQSAATQVWGDALTGVVHVHTDLASKTMYLTDAQKEFVSSVQASVDALNAEGDAMKPLQDQYDAISSQLTLVTDKMKEFQNVLNHPLEGQNAISDELHQNELAQSRLKEQKDKLLAQGFYSADPQIKNIDYQIGVLANEADIIKQRETQTIKDQQFQLAKLKNTTDEYSFAVESAAATSLGNLNKEQAALQVNLDTLKPTLDTVKTSYDEQKKKVDMLVSGLEGLSSTNEQVRASTQSLTDTIHSNAQAAVSASEQILSAQHGVDDAVRAVSQSVKQVTKDFTDGQDTIAGAQHAVELSVRAVDSAAQTQAKDLESGAHSVQQAEVAVRDSVKTIQDAHDAMSRAVIEQQNQIIANTDKWFTQIDTIASKLKDLADTLKTLMSTDASGLNGQLSALTGAFGNALGLVQQLQNQQVVALGNAIQGGGLQFLLASGGDASPGSSGWVGEDGPEYMDVKRGGGVHVYSHEESLARFGMAPSSVASQSQLDSQAGVLRGLASSAGPVTNISSAQQQLVLAADAIRIELLINDVKDAESVAVLAREQMELALVEVLKGWRAK